MEPDACLSLALDLMRAVGDELRSRGCDTILFSGGIDTSFVALSAVKAGLRPRLITVLFPGSRDEAYVDLVASRLGLELVKVRPTVEEALRCADEALTAIETIDPIEVISASAVCLGLAKARELGSRCVATGDGGDELFIGYDFLLDADPGRLSEWLEKVIRGAFFNSVPMGSRLGVRVYLPLYSQRAKEIALRASPGCTVRPVRGRPFGKYLLRLALEAHGLVEVAWRPKDPITRGSGVELLLDSMRRLITTEEAVSLARATSIAVPSYPHAYLLKRRLTLGLSLPPRHKEGSSCPVCGRQLHEDHCPFCGAYVGKGAVSVYSDELYRVTGPLRAP